MLPRSRGIATFLGLERSCGRGSSERLFRHGLEAMVAQGARLFEVESNGRASSMSSTPASSHCL